MTITAPTGAASAVCIGAATASVVASIHLQAQERAARVSAIAYDAASSDTFEASGIVAVDPASGTALLAGTPGLAIDPTDNNRLDFSVPYPGAWRGELAVTFVYDYEV